MESQRETIPETDENGAAAVNGFQPAASHPKVAVVIPCFRAAATLGEVVRAIPPLVSHVYIVDDACPEESWRNCDPGDTAAQLIILWNPANLGVGGAVKRGYAAALADGADVIVKLDADGQMDPAFIPRLIAPILAGHADYTKGNRFARRPRMPRGASQRGRMPRLRRIGNNILSFVHKGVTGCWHVVDPTNGYTAVHRRALQNIELDHVANCYFFEIDMLFHLTLAGGVVEDVPLPARYGDEVSSLRVRHVVRRFPGLALRRFLARIASRYFLDDFNVASLEILFGLPLLLFGTALGAYHWVHAVRTGIPTTAGTVMFAALPIILGFQLLLSAVGYDIVHRPRVPLSARNSIP